MQREERRLAPSWVLGWNYASTQLTPINGGEGEGVRIAHLPGILESFLHVVFDDQTRSTEV